MRILADVISFLGCGDSPIKKPHQKIENLCIHTDHIQPGDLYIAVMGTTQHGDQYLEVAAQKGAVTALSDRPYEPSHQLPVIVCPDLKQRLPALLSWFYGNPSVDDMQVIGVTGTNGKTSVCHFIAQILTEAGHKVGMMGTAGSGVWPNLQPANQTTLDICRVYQALETFHVEQIDTLVFEASSHGLHQGRLEGVAIDIAVFTNLSRDHLDYHGDMESYFQAKKILFLWPTLRTAVINIGNTYGQRLYREIAQERPELRLITFSTEPTIPADIAVQSIATQDASMNLEITLYEDHWFGRLPVVGLFNIENVLATFGVLLAQGWTGQTISSAAQAIGTVPGRMEVYQHSNHPTVLIDFAHTPEAIEQVLLTARELCKGKLWVVFGCGGNRDKGKRPLMAKAIEHLADHIIVTEDNSRHEPLTQIVADILSGFKRPNCVIVQQRREAAISYAIQHAQPLDWVVLLGKGHENYLDVEGQKIPFSEQEIVQRYLQEL